MRSNAQMGADFLRIRCRQWQKYYGNRAASYEALARKGGPARTHVDWCEVRHWRIDFAKPLDDRVVLHHVRGDDHRGLVALQQRTDRALAAIQRLLRVALRFAGVCD